MKAAPNIFPEIIRTKNMLVAARDVARGKRHKKDVGLFLFNLENEIVDLQLSFSINSPGVTPPKDTTK